MAEMDIRYAVAGSPIAHSLSPIIAALTAAHLARADLIVNLNENSLLDCDDVTAPMAWAWAEGSRQRSVASSKLFGDLSQPQYQSLMRRAIDEVLISVSSASPELVPNGESLLYQDTERLKTRRGATEAWISLTSPLKHQLNTRSGVTCIDASLQNGAVNHLRWDGLYWHCAGTDGPGLVAVARHFGFDFDAEGVESPLLCMTGGGGAARSCAVSWAENGGKIWSMGGRRSLDNRGPWVNSILEGEAIAEMIGPRLQIDFDQPLGTAHNLSNSDADLELISNYDVSDSTQIVEQTESGLRLDGRWLLVAQHLDAWARLFTPEAAHLIPGLGLTMSRLLAVESMLKLK